MGKADASLPDPLTAPTPALAGTDDLLSQLAGDEIDRLLAEADVTPDEAAAADASGAEAARELDAQLAGSAPRIDPARQALDLLDSVQNDADAIERSVRELAPPMAPAAVDAAPASGGVEDELKALFAELNEPLPAADLPPVTKTFAATSTTAAEDAAASASLSAEIDDLFKQLTAEQPAIDATADAPQAEVAPSPVQPAAVAPPEATAASASPVAAPPSHVEPDAAAAMQERAGLGLAGLATSVAPATAQPKPAAGADAEAPLPMVLRPLEWMSAPLAGAGDSIRELVGKAAIVTFVNAAAVLTYVMFFRK